MKKAATFLLAIGLTSCVTPEATVLTEEPVNLSQESTPAPKGMAQVSSESLKPAKLPNRRNGIRLPDMLALPEDDQLRSAPDAPKDGSATVIVRPPEE